MSLPIQMLWVEGPLSPLERLSMQSYLRCGHPVHLYVYRDVTGIPAGVTIVDGRSVLPEDRICRKCGGVSEWTSMPGMVCIRLLKRSSDGSKWMRGNRVPDATRVRAPPPALPAPPGFV